MNVLLMHSSRFGHTAKVIQCVADELHAAGHAVTVRPSHVVRQIPEHIDAVVLGASVRYGFYAPHLKAFARKNAERLNTIPTAFIGISLSSDKPERSEPMTNVYSRKFLEAIPWKPKMSQLFTGEIVFDLYNTVDSFLMEKILQVSGKPYGPGVHVDYTDWDGVREFARNFEKLLA